MSDLNEPFRLELNYVVNNKMILKRSCYFSNVSSLRLNSIDADSILSTCFSAAVKALASSLPSATEEVNGVGSWHASDDEESMKCDSARNGLLAAGERLIKARLLVAFIDALEKLMFNAGAGTSNAFSPPPKVCALSVQREILQIMFYFVS